jgi:cholesterol transport system auxiliary component
LPAVLLLGGCISLGTDPPAELISLTPELTAPAGDIGGNPAAAIVVLDPDTDRSLDVQRVPVQISPSAIAYLTDASWVEKPSRQFRALLAETIRAKSHRLVFEGIGFAGGHKRVLSGRLISMGYHVPSASVIVRFDALLTAPGGEVRAQRFEAKVPGVAAKANAVAPALNTAANQVAVQVADWVR